MNLDHIIDRLTPPDPWAEGDNIPWHDPEFSKRMLKEHLSQDHDMASRRFEKIGRHVEWIHRKLLSEQPSRILDIGCGPGFYLHRLAKLGHECSGIDYSPASIEYAREEANKDKLDIQYKHEDMRKADFGTEFNLVTLIFGEFSVFRPSDAESILQKAANSLVQSGTLLMEVHIFESIREMSHQPPSWYSSQAGLFSDRPHLCLQENFWDEESRTATTRYYVIDASTDEMTAYAASYQAYSIEEYRTLLSRCGFTDIKEYPSLTGTPDEAQKELMVLAAKKSLAPNH